MSIAASSGGRGRPARGRGRVSAAARGATSVLVLGMVMATTAALWGIVRPQGAPLQPVTTSALQAASPTSPGPAPTPSPAATAPDPSPPQMAMGEMDEGDEAAPATRTSLITAADRGAGLRTVVVPAAGKRTMVIVPGEQKPPGRGRVHRVRVEVESGLDVDGAAFARFVMATLNDRRGWGHGGSMTFARTAGRTDIRVVLASPATSAAMCRPLITKGTLSCANGSTAVLTVYRWVRGTADYGADITGYRQYLVNHEVGHVLGHGHQACPGRGRRAPVMLQQTKGLKGCTKNPWPFP